MEGRCIGLSRCPYCGCEIFNQFPMAGYAQCANCGHEFTMMSPEQSNVVDRMYQRARTSRTMWRVLFVLAELFSFFIALGCCWLFAKVLDTQVFVEHTVLIFVVWAGVVVWIYKKCKPHML